MIRVVIDTNILVSALLQPLGLPAQVFVLALSGSAARDFNATAKRLRRRSEPSARRRFWVKPTNPVRACSDPDDDIFLECAQAAQADYIVTGNLKHFPDAWEGTRIVPPRHLLELVQSAYKETE